MSFVFALVHPTSQAWAKADVARSHPDLRPAYSRPGLTTWKTDAVPEEIVIATPFARVWGHGIGTRATTEEILATAREQARGGQLRLHVYARDAKDGDGPPPEDEARARTIERDLRALAPELFRDGPEALAAERVLDVIVAAEDPPYVGVHVQGDRAIPWPGGRFPIAMPDDAPSRAYLKLEEMLAWSRLAWPRIVPSEGDVAVALGGARGGAAYALAAHGASVVAIDSTPIDPRVLAFVGPGGARVKHVPVSPALVLREHLPAAGAKWLLIDVNLAPPVALRHLEAVAAKLTGWETMIVTLKITDQRVAESVPQLLARIAKIAGGGEVRAIQLASHRREIGVLARRGTERASVRDGGARGVRARGPARGAGGPAGRGRPGGAPPRAPRTR